MGWLGNIFGKKQDAFSTLSLPPALPETDGAAVADLDPAQARDLINRAAHEVLSLNGIPKDWVRFEILTLSDASKAYFQLQVTMVRWDAYLLLHSLAFEKTVMARVRERSTTIAQALRAVLWRVASNTDCPYEKLPPSVAWTPEAIAQRQSSSDIFKAPKPREEMPKSQPAQLGQDDFQPTLQVANNQQEADAALQQIMQARQAKNSKL